MFLKALQQMKEDIVEKESRLTSINKQLEDTENELHKVRQELYAEQMHTSELEDEVPTWFCVENCWHLVIFFSLLCIEHPE